MKLARTNVLPAVVGKQPGLAGSHTSLLARGAPSVAQQKLTKVRRENDISVLLTPRFREGKLVPCSIRMSIRSLSISVSFSDTTSDDRRPVA